MNIYELLGTTVVEAATKATSPVAVFVGKVNRILINPLIILMFAAALVYFLYGVFEFMANADQSEARETGKRHIMWGLIGMFIMFAVFAILKMIERTFGLTPNPNF